MATPPRHRILRYWKPDGVLTKFTDADERPTLAGDIDVPGVWPAGRLDRDSEGLLLLTDDPWLRTRLTDPRFEHPRTYLVQVEGIPGEAALEALRRGVDLKDGPTRPALAELLADPPGLPPRPRPVRVRHSVPDRWVRLTLTEGRNRQVRRMTAAVGHPTLRLVREAVGPITLDGLQPGHWADLTPGEVAALDRSVRSGGGRTDRGGGGRSAARRRPAR